MLIRAAEPLGVSRRSPTVAVHVQQEPQADYASSVPPGGLTCCCSAASGVPPPFNRSSKSGAYNTAAHREPP